MPGFARPQDTPLSAGKRWQSSWRRRVLAAAACCLRKRPTSGSGRQSERQAGGRVFLFLYTDDFRRDHAAFKERGVVFVEEPRVEPYGTVAAASPTSMAIVGI